MKLRDHLTEARSQEMTDFDNLVLNRSIDLISDSMDAIEELLQKKIDDRKALREIKKMDFVWIKLKEMLNKHTVIQ
jgi:hypothetical protein